MTDNTQISRDHGTAATAAITADDGQLPALVDGIDLEQQLRQARRIVCVPEERNDDCVALVNLSLRLAAGDADAAIRADYDKLRIAQSS